MAMVHTNTELEIILDLERQFTTLLVTIPRLSELPIAPLRGVGDLVRLELALRRFARIHRSRRSKLLVGSARVLLDGARSRLRAAAAADRFDHRARLVAFRDTQPAV
jgi:hypothetical protein